MSVYVGDATSVGVPEEGRRGIGAPGLEVSVVVRWVLGTKLRVSARAAGALC